MSEPGWACALVFDTDDPQFVRGCEIGSLWEMLKGADGFDQIIHATNSEMALRAMEAQGRAGRGEPMDETWTMLRVEPR